MATVFNKIFVNKQLLLNTENINLADPTARFKLINIEYYKDLDHRHRKINSSQDKQLEKKFRVKYDVLHIRLCDLA